MSVRPVKFGFLGYGPAALYFHLPYIVKNPDIEIHAVCQRKTPEEVANSSKSFKGGHCTVDFPQAKWYREVDEFLADPEIDVVLVLTFHDTHSPFAEKALLAGKHVVVEKPVATNTAEFEKAIAAAHKTGKLLIPYQNRRYDSDMQTLIKILQQGLLGKVHEAEIHYDLDLPFWVVASMQDPGWKPGDGMNFGIGCHSLDQALHLFGRPQSVTAFYRTLRDVESESEDSFTMILQYADSPLIVTVKTNVRTKMRYPLKYFVRGTLGTFTKHGTDPQEGNIMNEKMSVSDERFGVEPEDTWGTLETSSKVMEGQIQTGSTWTGRVKSEKGSYFSCYADVVRAVRGEISPVIKAETSRDGIRIIELARESAEKGKTILMED